MSERRPLIWICDDSPTEGAITRASLGAGYDFEYFEDGSLVVERLSTARAQPDVLVLDWVMPGMPGDEVCRFLRSQELTRDLPIIITTSSRIDTHDVVVGLSSGADDYVSRPFMPEELRARVNAALRTRELTEASKRERRRLAAVNRLTQALLRVHDVRGILEALAVVLVGGLCDGCGIVLVGGEQVTHHTSGDPSTLVAIANIADPAVHAFDTVEARAALPASYRDHVARFGLSALAILAFPASSPIHGVVTLTRDAHGVPFDADDLAVIETCVECCTLAIQNALRLDVERTAHAERERVVRFQEEMVAIVGHDLRSPLGAMITGAEILSSSASEYPTMMPIVTRMRSSGERMTKIIDQLLDVTHARLGKGIPLDRREASLRGILEGVVGEATLAMPRTQFVLEATDDVSDAWDPDRLAQVFANLAANASHYGKPGGPVVLSLVATETTATVLVQNPLRDTPIPPGLLAVLFDPFQRGRAAGANAGGLGLGLYIVREIVHAHGGTIDVTSDTRTTFRVKLPRRPHPAG